MLHIKDLTYRIGGRALFDSATVAVPAGHRVGLVGRNGTGKTTLFRLIAGDIPVDAGSITLHQRARIGRVQQDTPSGPQSLIDFVLAADAERESLLAEAETATDPQRIAEIHNRLADTDAHTAPARAAAILAGLGFDDEAQQRPLDSFSGGWRMRVALAATLFTRPDVLLLDEPSNHLDLEATLWLEGYLSEYPGTLLLISHERGLLNTVPEEIIHLENGKLNRYAGNYDRFERTRRERLELQSRMQSRQLVERRRIQAFVDRFRYKATKARQAQSRMKALERMEPIVSVVEERTTAFNFPDPTPLSPPLLALEETTIGYGDKAILKGLDLRIDMDDRIGLLGANGNGKSTLIKMLADRLKPMSGKVRKSPKLKIGYFSQDQADELNLGGTPLSHMAEVLPLATEAKQRAHLANFGFGEDKATTTVANLSGGEKARLLFALMSREAPHLMLLDEPTNHLDVDAREALIQALNQYDGAVVLVSHDPHLLDLVCDRLWLVGDGACAPFEGDMADYRRFLAERRKQARRSMREERGNDNGSGETQNRRENRRERAAARAETASLRKATQVAEKRLEKLHAEKDRIEAAMADPTLYEGPKEKLTALQIKLGKTNKDLEEAEAVWIEAYEALEAAQGVE
ncbi:MAG: ABC-F family ATP-binding cassette domain-containing protein [Rhodospirillales bacterium]|nr:ABC-F family ATP-binding cassette domain-containing protein [Rhodospirillales bacterium]